VDARQQSVAARNIYIWLDGESSMTAGPYLRSGRAVELAAADACPLSFY
jgi:hypothetical protein